MTTNDFLPESLLEVDANGNPTSKDLRLMVLTLLHEMAEVDGKVSPEEIHEIVRAMDHEFHLMDGEVGEMLEVAKFFRGKREELEKMFTELNRSFSPEQREHIFDLIWKVVEADGRLDPYEKAFARFVQVKLNVSRTSPSK